jgi:hypothetical protein
MTSIGLWRIKRLLSSHSREIATKPGGSRRDPPASVLTQTGDLLI